MRGLINFLKNRRIQGAGAYFLVQIFQSGIGLVLIPLYTRYLSPADYGIVQTCAAIGTAVTSFAFLCVQEAAYFALVRKEQDAPRVVASVLLVELALALAVLPIVGVVAFVWPHAVLAGVELSPFIAGVLFAATANLVVTTYTMMLQAVEEVRKCALVSFAIFVAVTALQVYLLVDRKLAAASYIYAQAAVYGVAAVIAIVVMIRRFGFRPSREHVRRALAFSTPLVPHNAAHWARANVDRVMLSSVTSTAQTGVYGMAATYVGIANMATEAFRIVNNPRFFDLIKKDDEAHRSQLTSILPVSMLGLAAISIVMSLLSKDIFRWFLAPAYWEAYRYVPLLMVSGLVFAIYINLVNVLFDAKRTTLIGMATVLGSAIGVGATAFLVQQYGAWGSAAGILVVNVAITAFVAVFAQRVKRIAWPWAPTLLAVVSPLVCYAGGLLTSESLALRAGIAAATSAVLALVALPYFRALLAHSNEPA